MCLSFWYHLFGPHTGTLSLKLRLGGGDEETVLWTRSGTQGNEWQRGLSPVPHQNRTFENLVCDFRLDCSDQSDEMDCGDHLSLARAHGQLLSKAKALSPVLGPSGPACSMQFRYLLYSNSTFTGGISVSSVDLALGTEVLLWRTHRTRDKWTIVTVSVGARPRGFQIEIATLVDNFVPRVQKVAVDDIAFLNCSPDLEPPTAAGGISVSSVDLALGTEVLLWRTHRTRDKWTIVTVSVGARPRGFQIEIATLVDNFVPRVQKVAVDDIAFLNCSPDLEPPTAAGRGGPGPGDTEQGEGRALGTQSRGRALGTQSRGRAGPWGHRAGGGPGPGDTEQGEGPGDTEQGEGRALGTQSRGRAGPWGHRAGGGPWGHRAGGGPGPGDTEQGEGRALGTQSRGRALGTQSRGRAGPWGHRAGGGPGPGDTEQGEGWALGTQSRGRAGPWGHRGGGGPWGHRAGGGPWGHRAGGGQYSCNAVLFQMCRATSKRGCAGGTRTRLMN
ncbi:Apical endosomal glycoprotein [Acipenser ruthenus]|uniref:Apical endosomal glycoprotein n=1 Tax=Acipenser ruthenus TaxID=7906 RepID=A0A444UWZ6_ACIRT|nr:Apical endosomal glycoprotein [Acipenser ruthenus]